MKGTIEEYGGVLVQALIGAVLLALLFAVFSTDSLPIRKAMPAEAEKSVQTGDFSGYNGSLPRLETVSGAYFNAGDEIDLLSEDIITSATDSGGNDISGNVRVFRIVDAQTGERLESLSHDKSGAYEITYILVDSEKQRTRSKTKVIVEEKPEEEEMEI